MIGAHKSSTIYQIDVVSQSFSFRKKKKKASSQKMSPNGRGKPFRLKKKKKKWPSLVLVKGVVNSLK